MTNPKDKLSSIFKALALETDETVESIESIESIDELVQDEAQKWPLFKALAPKKPARTAALTSIDKQNWASVEPPPPQAVVADNFSDKLAAGLGKMAVTKKPAARKQAKAKKEDPQPQATRAKPAAKKAVLAKIAKEASVPLSVIRQEPEVTALKTEKTPKAPSEIRLAPAPIPFPAVNRPAEPLATANERPISSGSSQAAVNPQVKKGVESPGLGSPNPNPNVNSLLSLFNLDAPTSEVAPKAPATTKERTPEPSAAPPSGVRSALVASEPMPSGHTMPVEKAPLTSAALPIAAAQSSGTLKSLLNKLQTPDAPLVKTPGFLNRLNKK